MKQGKKYRAARAQVDPLKKYSVEAGFELTQKLAFAKFDESVDVAINLGIDTKLSDQAVRGAVVLPHGVGGTAARVVVIAKGDKAKEAESAGADAVGAEELIEKIGGGWLDFDKLIATPDMMVAISKIGRILGPKGLMPNPKLGTVTFEVGKAVKEQKQGKVEFRAEKAGIVHVTIGKKSFSMDQLKENFVALVGSIMKSKPPTSKGNYLKRVSLSTTMGPGVELDPAEVQGLVAS
jgi:large subunit ribosomal protein L1